MSPEPSAQTSRAADLFHKGKTESEIARAMKIPRADVVRLLKLAGIR